jgi:hypothetical protein
LKYGLVVSLDQIKRCSIQIECQEINQSCLKKHKVCQCVCGAAAAQDLAEILRAGIPHDHTMLRRVNNPLLRQRTKVAYNHMRVEPRTLTRAIALVDVTHHAKRQLLLMASLNQVEVTHLKYLKMKRSFRKQNAREGE